MKSRLIILLLICAVGWGYSQTSGSRVFFPPDPEMQLEFDSIEKPTINLYESAQEDVELKSRGKAFFMSLLLPGLGERYVGDRLKSELFMATELALWLGVIGLDVFQDWKTDEYITFAASHANVQTGGKDHTFYVNIGNFDSIDDYNAAALRERQLKEFYRDRDGYYWKWDTPGHREQMKDIRIAADRADNAVNFVIGAIVANHIVSAIDAMWSVHRYNKSAQSVFDMDVKFGTSQGHPNVRWSLSARF